MSARSLVNKKSGPLQPVGGCGRSHRTNPPYGPVYDSNNRSLPLSIFCHPTFNKYSLKLR